jgi:hypothetical protein
MRLSGRCLVVSLFLLVSGCTAAGYTPVAPGRHVVLDNLSVEPGTAWTQVQVTVDDIVWASTIYTSGDVGLTRSTKNAEVWTIDVPSLESVVFFVGVADGQALIEPAEGRQKLPPFHSNMAPNDVMELVRATLTQAAAAIVSEGRNLRPAKVADIDGFRFDLDYTLKDEVDRNLTAIGVVRDGRLYLILYQGTKIYYYDKHLADFERLAESVRFTKT